MYTMVFSLDANFNVIMSSFYERHGKKKGKDKKKKRNGSKKVFGKSVVSPYSHESRTSQS